jgi:hypothetical protein
VFTIREDLDHYRMDERDDSGRKVRAGVEFVIEKGDMPALDYAGPRVVGPSNFVLVNPPVTPDWEPIPGGEPTIELYVEAADADDARRKAEEVYAELRREGGLSTRREPRIVGIYMDIGADPLWLQHFDEAADMIEQQRYEVAVVTAQIACEIEIKAAIEAAADAPEGSLARLAIDAPRSYSLIDRRAREVFVALLGGRPTEETFWEGYRDHVERRNNVLHRGARVVRADAVASVGAAEEMVAWAQRLRPGFDGPISLRGT